MAVEPIFTYRDGGFPIDREAVMNTLPIGSAFVSVEPFGASVFTTTAKLVALDPDGSEKAYFLKIAYGETGRIMLNGEHESFKSIYSTMPNFIPKPFGFGQYKSLDSGAYYHIVEFVDMDVTSAPDPAEFTRRLAHLHKISQSPTGMFGFHTRTCDGDRAHVVDWQKSWTVFYRNLFLGVCKLDIEKNGHWEEYERAIDQIAWKIVPRLLEPLESDGRQIKPCLIHGDLWEGNMGINMETGDTLLFDASSYYAHNEMELGHWRCEFSSVFRSTSYKQHYLEHYPAAEPADEFEDRNRLYSLKGAINYSAGHPGTILRKTAYNDMCYLCERYAPIRGIDKYNPQIDPSLTGAWIVPHMPE
ncbi:Fructosamine kinase-domain-containing protein [Annulohypoxylon moriforme]|nr:Fructosamine kinase-domain-containing protein [Annulohypoxylon moriforme]